MPRLIFLLFLFLILFSCTTQKERAIEIESFRNLTEIPSASGVQFIDNEIWMVGDDSPFLYQFDSNLKLLNKYKISSIENKMGKRVDKFEKADYESIAGIGDSLFILGSGSVEGSRDTMVIFNMKQEKVISKYNVRKLYSEFLGISVFDTTKPINIEGLVVSNHSIYFLNRGNVFGNNDIYQSSILGFYNYLKKDTSINLSYQRYSLPEINQFTSGFSGVCTTQDGQYLYFTSSVEATNDAYSDGEVLGSFIGRIHLENKEIQTWPLIENDQFVKTKLESISIIENNTEFIRFVCTSDNDDGTSGVYYLKLNLKPESYE